MLRERYDPMNLSEYIPALGMETDAVLSQLDTLLDDDVLFQTVKADLVKRFPRTSSFGRPSTPARSSCACWWSSTSTTGVTSRLNNGSAIA